MAAVRLRGGSFASLPNFCSHEHWGSIASIGTFPGGYRADIERGARPRRRTTLIDLVVEPYFRGWMTAGGATLDFNALFEKDPWDAWSALQPVLARHRFSGVYQCSRRGILSLYGADISRLTKPALQRLNDAITDNYARHLDWYRRAMKQANFSDVIRPVHPEFYSAARPAERTMMRIDPLLDLWKADNPRRRAMAALARVEPADAKSWREFLTNLFDLASRNGAAGTKQLQAYRRPLHFEARSDSDVVFSGELTAGQQRTLQDWIVHECSKQAHERGWPHQVHVGTNNITESTPMPLASLARAYPKMKIVMIHCWPFLKEAGWLAKFHPNVYIDTCWQPILNPQFFREAITTWWNYVPTHKITCGHDATTVEMAVGSSLFTREALEEVLPERTRQMGATEAELRDAAAAVLHGNAAAIYS